MNPLDSHATSVRLRAAPASTAGNGQPNHALFHPDGQHPLHSLQFGRKVSGPALTLPIALAYRLHAGHLCHHAEASARFFIFCYAALAIPCMMQLDFCDHY